MRFKIDWASLIVGRKFTVFALFCFVFEGNFQVQAPPGGGGIFGRVGGVYLEGLIFGIFWGGGVCRKVERKWTSFISEIIDYSGKWCWIGLP